MITFRLTKILFCRSALRLTLSKRWKHDVTAIRNVGIIAHIDAGKTTTTERMLYYAGLTRSVGEVHDGDTVTDFMDAERERGITINSAAITFPWKTIDKSFVVNLIDTPGHVDFTIEVERSLRVLDGGVVILDASAGVQAQTLTVWRQADAHNRERSVKVPRILFVNKMDKPNASLDMSLKSVQTRLHCDPILIQMPIGSGRDFQGVVDLITMEARTWNRDSDVTQGKSFKISSLEDGDLKERAKELRNEMVERLCEFDDDLADLVISNPDYENYDLIPNSVLMDSIRKVVLNRPGEAAITLVGSAYKNIGVQPLMDAIGNYLPSPVDIKQPFLQNDLFKDKFCGMAFKISHPTAQKAQQKAGLAYTFIRVYNGEVSEGDTVYNHRLESTEKIQKMYIAFADDFRATKSLKNGQIGIISGLKMSSTGDMLLSASIKNLAPENIPKLTVPAPVLFSSVEANSSVDQKRLELALKNLAREDPSLRVSLDEGEESDNSRGMLDQIVISGMGELHLEIILDRIKREYKVDADLGPLMISYRETLSEKFEDCFTFERTMLDKKMRVMLDLVMIPHAGDVIPGNKPQLKIRLEEMKSQTSRTGTSVTILKPWQRKALERGFENSLSSGPLAGFPMTDFTCIVCAVEFGGDGFNSTADTIISAAMMEAMKQAPCKLLEPIMKLSISADQKHMSTVIRDLITRRRATLEEGWTGHEEVDATDSSCATVLAPLSELRGYSRFIRSATSGNASFGMEFSHYSQMSDTAEREAVKEITGF